jgi:hypothetical protein
MNVCATFFVGMGSLAGNPFQRGSTMRWNAAKSMPPHGSGSPWKKPTTGRHAEGLCTAMDWFHRPPLDVDNLIRIPPPQSAV